MFLAFVVCQLLGFKSQRLASFIFSGVVHRFQNVTHKWEFGYQKKCLWTFRERGKKNAQKPESGGKKVIGTRMCMQVKYSGANNTIFKKPSELFRLLIWPF